MRLFSEGLDLQTGPSRTFGNLFLSAGAMKAGTTWLYAALNRHPALHFTMEKELHYFYHRYVDDNCLSESARLQAVRDRYLLRFDPARTNIDAVRANLHWITSYLDRPVDDFWYRNLFQMRPHQIFACDFSNLYAHLPVQAWQRIADKCDRLRVIYTMRDPLARLWSHTKFHLQVKGELARLRDWGPKDYDSFARQPFIWNNGEYGQVLRRLRAGLPEASLMVLFYEDTHLQQRKTLQRIEGFLGIPGFDYPADVLARRFAESAKVEMPTYFPDLFAEDLHRIVGEVAAAGYSVPAGWPGAGTAARSTALTG